MTNLRKIPKATMGEDDFHDVHLLRTLRLNKRLIHLNVYYNTLT